MDIPILYRDEALLLCLKPAGPDAEHALPELLRKQTGLEELYCVHRLDRAVGGLTVYALTAAAAAALSRSIAAGGMEKDYLAVTEGESEDEAVLRDLLFRDAAKNKSYVVRRMRRGVREARLRYRTLARREGLNLLRVSLETGRSHQIRVQLASRQMPLVGDGRYGSRRRDCPLALWSEALRFPHPVTGEALSFRAGPPERWPWTVFGPDDYAAERKEREPCDTGK